MGAAGETGIQAPRLLQNRAIRLEWLSAGWMVAEAGVAVSAGVIAGSLALTSFGFDSVIELISASLVLRRLRAERAGAPADEQAERRVLRVIAATFLVLAGYVIIAAAVSLATQAQPERSAAGIGLTVSSLIVMPLLGWRKRQAGAALRSPLVLADASETILCATLAATTLLGLVLFAAFGWWWADPAAALAVAWFAVREGREAWHGELICDDYCSPELRPVRRVILVLICGFAATGGWRRCLPFRREHPGPDHSRRALASPPYRGPLSRPQR